MIVKFEKVGEFITSAELERLPHENEILFLFGKQYTVTGYQYGTVIKEKPSGKKSVKQWVVCEVEPLEAKPIGEDICPKCGLKMDLIAEIQTNAGRTV